MMSASHTPVEVNQANHKNNSYYICGGLLIHSPCVVSCINHSLCWQLLLSIKKIDKLVIFKTPNKLYLVKTLGQRIIPQTYIILLNYIWLGNKKLTFVDDEIDIRLTIANNVSIIN